MESIPCINMYERDYRNTSKSKPEHFSYEDTEYDRNCSHYRLNQDHSLKNNQFENKNQNSQNDFSHSNETNVSQNKNKECPLKNNNKSGNIGIQHFDGDNPMPLRQDNLPKDKRIMQIKSVKNKNGTFRPNRKCLRSVSEPSIFLLPPKQYVSGEGSDGNEKPESYFKNEKCFIVHPATILDKSPKKFQPSSKKRNQEIKSSQRSKHVYVKKRQDTRRRLKIPIKKIQITGNGKMHSHERGSLDSIKEIKFVPDRRYSDETDRCSSYSESENHMAKPKCPINERNMPNQNSQKSLTQSIPRSSFNDNVKYSSNALHFSNYKAPYEESLNENDSKKSDSRFTTDSFLRKELSDFKEFLIYRRNQQRQRLHWEQQLPTVYIPESFKLQKMAVCDHRTAKNDYENGKEYATGDRRQNHSNLKTKHTHKMPRPKVSDQVLWKRFEHNFKRYATTRRYSGEVIPRKISTEWMSKMGVVGDLLTEKDADNEFKKAAGPKVTMNMEEYKDFLITLTMKKKLPFYEIYRRMCGI